MAIVAGKPQREELADPLEELELTLEELTDIIGKDASEQRKFAALSYFATEEWLETDKYLQSIGLPGNTEDGRIWPMADRVKLAVKTAKEKKR